MSQDRLLSDEELKNAVKKGLEEYTTFVDGSIAVKTLLDLINTQKRLYAESVIGEDEIDYTMMPDIHRPNEPMQVPDYDAQLRNLLRAEQRKKING